MQRREKPAKPVKPEAPGDDGALAKLIAQVPPEPQLATLVESVAQPTRWRFELKFDGYRILAYCHGRSAILLSRRGLDWSGEFPPVVEALRELRLRGCVLDGEVCAIDEARGVPSFHLLQTRPPGVRLVYMAFDLLWQGSRDRRSEPLEERQAALEELIGHDPSHTVFAPTSTEGDPRAILRLACRGGYEGIVAKEKSSRYAGGRSRQWLKLKCSKRQEFAVIGYLPMVGASVVGALLLAVAETGGSLRFVYAGRVGTGFSSAERAELAHELDGHRIDAPAAGEVPTALIAKAVWAKPRLVAEVSYLERTKGELRHASFKGLRADKTPKDCTWETAEEHA